MPPSKNNQPASEKYVVETDCLIAFGANQGNRKDAFDKAIEFLANSDGVSELKSSAPVETVAVTGSSDGSALNDDDKASYLNACIRFSTTNDSTELHALITQIEIQLGRERKERWGARTIDLDLLLFGDKNVDEAKLTIPHPRMSFRRFVLEPANEIASDMVHPISGLTIAQLLSHLNGEQTMILVTTDSMEFADSVVDRVRNGEESQIKNGLDQGDFEINVVDETTSFIQNAGNAKLVCACFTQEAPNDIVRYAKNFAGPTLLLPVDKGISECANELSAAIKAMS